MMSIIDGKIWVRIGSMNMCRTSENLDPDLINEALRMFEEYIETVERSDSPNHKLL